MKEDINLYEVFNGYMRFEYYTSYVVARSEEEALELARPLFYAEAIKDGYPEKFYQELRVELLGKNVSNGFATRIEDC